MPKTTAVLPVILAIALTTAACQPRPVTPAAVTLPAPDSAFSTNSPIPTSLNAIPSPTSTEIPPAMPACIVAEGTPLSFLPGSQQILYRGEVGIHVLNLKARTFTEFLAEPEPGGLSGSAVALSPGGDLLAWALFDHSIQVYQTADRKLLQTLVGHTDIVTELEFSPDGEKLYSASHDTFVRVWDRDGVLVDSFQPTGAGDFPDEVLGLAVSPDGTLLATIPFDGPVKLWDAKTFSLVRTLGAFGGYDHSDAVFSPDGQYLAALTANGLFLWQVADGAQLMGGNPGINAMALNFSPDGRVLAYWDVEGKDKITFLTPDGSQEIRSLPGGGMMVMAVLFSPDHQLVLAGSNAESRIWRQDTGELLVVGRAECP